jgi:hypothetical protein
MAHCTLGQGGGFGQLCHLRSMCHLPVNLRLENGERSFIYGKSVTSNDVVCVTSVELAVPLQENDHFKVWIHGEIVLLLSGLLLPMLDVFVWVLCISFAVEYLWGEGH